VRKWTGGVNTQKGWGEGHDKTIVIQRTGSEATIGCLFFFFFLQLCMSTTSIVCVCVCVCVVVVDVFVAQVAGLKEGRGKMKRIHAAHTSGESMSEADSDSLAREVRKWTGGVNTKKERGEGHGQTIVMESPGGEATIGCFFFFLSLCMSPRRSCMCVVVDVFVAQRDGAVNGGQGRAKSLFFRGPDNHDSRDPTHNFVYEAC
jgi:hypothetical protein